MSESTARRRRSPQSHPSSVDFGSDTASDGSSRNKGAPFASPDNLQAAAIQIQSSLRSFGFSGRINFFTGSPEDVAGILNCIHSLLQRLQHEQYLKDDAQAEHRRLRSDAQSYEQNLTKFRKEIEVKDRDNATLRIKERQEVDRHAEELTIMNRDKDALQRQCNNLSRQQIQFQHEIRRKELQYEWLQEKLRNYLAERKRESSASMEIVGKLRRQQSPQPRERNKLVSKIDDIMPGRNGNSKKGLQRGGPKLDETMVKMIVTAYEEKQKELMAENQDLQEALNGIRKEYTDLMNAQMEKAVFSTSQLVRVDSKVNTTKRVSVEGSLRSWLPSPGVHSTDASASGALLDSQALTTSDYSSLLHDQSDKDYVGPPAEDIRRMAEIPDGVLNADHPDLVPWPIQHDVALRKVAISTESEEQSIMSTADHSTILPTVNEEQDTPDSIMSPKDPNLLETEEDEPMDAVLLAEQSDLVLTSLSASVEQQAIGTLQTTAEESSAAVEKEDSGVPETPVSAKTHSEADTTLIDEDVNSNDEEPFMSEDKRESSVPESAVTDALATVNTEDSTKIEDPSGSGTNALQISEKSKSVPNQEKEASEVTFVLKPRKSSSLEQQSSSDAGGSDWIRKQQKLVWPPPSTSPPPEEPSPPRMRPSLGKLPQPSIKPVPNAAFLSEEQLKTELRNRADDVEEGVRALKAACTSMQPENMRSVMEKRLHMELSMAANLAEQQEAVVNLALAGLEKVRRTAPGSDAEMEELTASVTSSLNKSELLVLKMIEMVDDTDSEHPLWQCLNEIMKEIRDLKEKIANRGSSGIKDSPLNVASSEELERSISSLRERAEGLNKEKEIINRAREDLSENKPKGSPSRRTWAQRAEEDKHLRGRSVDASSDEGTAKPVTLSRISAN